MRAPPNLSEISEISSISKMTQSIRTIKVKFEIVLEDIYNRSFVVTKEEQNELRFEMEFPLRAFRSTFVRAFHYAYFDGKGSYEIGYTSIDEKFNRDIDQEVNSRLPEDCTFDDVGMLVVLETTPPDLLSNDVPFRTAQMYLEEDLYYQVVSVTPGYYDKHLFCGDVIDSRSILKQDGRIYVLTTSAHDFLTDRGNEVVFKYDSTGYMFGGDDEEWVDMTIRYPRTLNWDVLLKAIQDKKCNLPADFLKENLAESMRELAI